MLLCDVQGGWRNPQVLSSPRMPKALIGHLPNTQGMETATGMAPPRGEGVGWERLSQLFLTNYGCHWSRSYAPCLRQPTTQEWQKPMDFSPCGVSRAKDGSYDDTTTQH